MASSPGAAEGITIRAGDQIGELGGFLESTHDEEVVVWLGSE